MNGLLRLKFIKCKTCDPNLIENLVSQIDMVIVERLEKTNIDMKQMGHITIKKTLALNVTDDVMIEREEIIMGDTVMIDITSQRIMNVKQEMKEVTIARH